jgi:hypothetical protein
VTRIKKELINMKKIQKLFALTAVIAMLASSGYSQEYYYPDFNPENGYDNDAYAYGDSSDSSQSALLPIGIVIIAGALFALNRDHGHHGHRRGGGGGGSTSHSH